EGDGVAPRANGEGRASASITARPPRPLPAAASTRPQNIVPIELESHRKRGDDDISPDRWGECPPGMVPVPAGRFNMGSPEGVGEADEHPQHEVILSAYCIDKTEVTVKAYAACVAAKGCTPALHTISDSLRSAADLTLLSQWCNHEDRPDHPINCVDWD